MLKFDPELHRYTVNDKQIESVTQILSAEGLINNHYYGSEWHMKKGRYLHDAVKYYIHGELDMDSLDPLLLPYLIAFQKFLDDTGFKIEGIETPLYHAIYHYCGTPDLWGELNNKKIIIDLKTGGEAKWHSVQVAAYLEILKQNGVAVTGGAVLYLQENENYILKSIQDTRQGVSVFLSALTLMKWKKENLQGDGI